MPEIRDQDWFEQLPVREKARFLSSLAHNLTVVAREAYPAADPSLPDGARIRILQGVNELQHQISSQLGHYLDNDPKRYPDGVFWSVLAEEAQAAGLTRSLRWAIQQAWMPAEAS